MYSTLHITDGAARSSTHSDRWSNNGLACQVVLAPPATIALQGTHRLISVANGVEASPEVFQFVIASAICVAFLRTG